VDRGISHMIYIVVGFVGFSIGLFFVEWIFFDKYWENLGAFLNERDEIIIKRLKSEKKNH